MAIVGEEGLAQEEPFIWNGGQNANVEPTGGYGAWRNALIGFWAYDRYKLKVERAEPDAPCEDVDPGSEDDHC